MRLESTRTDALGETHLTYSQTHAGVPVFGTAIKTHFDASGRLKAVNGTAIPDLTVSPVPAWGVDLAILEAQRSVENERGAGAGLRTGATRLVIFRDGLVQGIPGDNHLAWEIEVTDGAGIRDVVYIGAQTGKFLDRIQGIQDDMFRRAYDGKGLPAPPTNYPNGAFWTEGDHFPTSKDEANNMITSTAEVHGFFDSVFDRDSFDGEGTGMDMIFNRGYSCPNASWNGYLHLLLPRLHRRRRDRARVGSRLHAAHPRPRLPVAAGRAERVLFGHLGRDHRPHQQPRQ
jgi:Zn-dependent metalloprotease